MSPTVQITLLVFAAFAGLSGWGAVAAWWLRERTKTVQGIKRLRRTNDRLQKTVVFTLDKWREQVERNQIFLAIEQEYADRLAQQAGVSASHVKTTVRATVEQAWRSDEPLRTDPAAGTHYRHELAAIAEVERFVETGEGTIAEFEIGEGQRKAA
ncbi:MAG: hypothetical protein VX672_07160 [Planctomycetota bacterium]|nr:hypothetical protein [Planctomycetota bacterium]